MSRKQPDTERLDYICYDIVDTSAGYAQRYEELEQMDLDPPIYLAPSALLVGSEASPAALSVRMQMARGLGYEGLIIRGVDGKYEPGKRSKSLVKLKTGMLQDVPIEEEEFLVTDIVSSKDGWAICVCACTHGEFRVTAPGSMPEKYKVMEDRLKYLGSQLTVQFSEYTPDGIPFHPVAISFRQVHE